jgi:hypothetical protein
MASALLAVGLGSRLPQFAVKRTPLDLRFPLAVEPGTISIAL